MRNETATSGACWVAALKGPRSYGPVAALLDELQRARIDGLVEDGVIFLEHRPVVTLGRRGRDRYLKLDPADYRRRGIELHTSARGGDVTYHGPGQLVMYPVIRLGGREADAHGYMANLEEIAIRTAAEFGVRAYRRPRMNGAWTDEGKIAAIGFRLKRWVTSHGMSFNVSVDLAGFDTIVPCGLAGHAVASLNAVLGDRAPDIEAVRTAMQRHFAAVCQRPLSPPGREADNFLKSVFAKHEVEYRTPPATTAFSR